MDHDNSYDPAPPEPPRPGQMRSEPRDSMFLLGTMARPGDAQVPIKVRNLSSGGMMVECPGGFANGETVVAHVGRLGTIHGKIAWAMGPRVGVAFDWPIDPKRARRPVVTAPQQLVQAARSSWRPGLR